MKNSLYENGVYIYANKKLHKPEEFSGEEGRVVIVIGSDAFEVCKEQIKNATWEEAMEFASSRGGNLPTKLQRIIMHEYHDDINKAIKKIGGTQLCESWEWLCEEYSFLYAWYFNGLNGSMSTNDKFNTCTGRPLLAFQLDELVD